MKSKLTLFILSFLMLSSAFAQWERVTVTGLPTGVGISTMYHDGTTFWAGSVGEIYKSSDNGSTWTEVNNGLQSGVSGVSGITKLGNRIYASFSGNGNYFVYYTTDEGANWVLDTAGWRSIAGVVPAAVQLLTFKEYVLAKCESNYIMYKKNSDTKWSTLNVLSAFRTPGAMYYVGDSLFLGLGYVSGTADMGVTWSTPRSSVLPAGLPLNFLHNAQQDHSNPATLYANLQILSNSKNYMYVTKDNQYTWDSIPVNLKAPNAISAMYANGNEIYAAYQGSFTDSTQKMFTSADGGKTWTDITTNLYSYTPFKFLSINRLLKAGGYIYASGLPDGIFRYQAGSSGVAETVRNYQLDVYPNPASQVVHLSQPADAYTLTNLQGSVVRSENGNAISQVDIRSLDPGIYLLQLESAGKIAVKKIVVE